MNYEIVYNSDLIIDEKSVLATLAVFYDRINLPGCTEQSRSEYVHLKRASRKTDSLEVVVVATTLKYDHPREGRIMSGEDVTRWEEQTAPLWDENVLVRLKPPSSSFSGFDFLGLENPELFSLLIRSPHVLTSTEGREDFFIRQDLLQHFLRADIELPSIFLTRNTKDTRRIMMSLQAQHVFAYLVPALSGLEPEEILAVRDKVKDNREGFLMHLQKLSKEVEARIREGVHIREISEHARSVVETDLIPDYVEFRRQLEAEKAGFWARVLDKASKVMEINAPPWTPKFYGDLIGAIGLTGMEADSASKSKLSNRVQAFHFISKIERNMKSRF